jgi:hypothetical protein
MNWQPIKTAPKDGTEILAVGQWHGEIGEGELKPSIHVVSWVYGIWEITGSCVYGSFIKATHWMPLPEKPKTD